MAVGYLDSYRQACFNNMSIRSRTKIIELLSGIHKEQNKQSVVSGACTSIVQSEALCERLIAGLTGVQARPMPMPRITDKDNVQMLT